MIPSPSFQVVCFGETLWDILPDNSLPGGAPMNVAYHLNKMGVQPALITRIGNDFMGSRLFSLLREYDISDSYVQTDETFPTGKVYAQRDKQGDVQYDIVYPAAWDYIGWEDRFENLLAEAQYFVYGSLTSRHPVSRATLYRLLEIARIKVLDVNLRPPYFESSQVEYLLQKADILKMNKDEFELISNWYGNLSQREDQMKLLQDRFGIEKVVVSLGTEGSILLDKGKIFRHPGYGVHVDDTIGCGDAFLAGLLQKFIRGADPADVLSCANSLGALVATYPGACPDYHPEEALFIQESANKTR